MRIIIVSDLYPPVVNGIATFTRNLAIKMVERGHDVLVIAPSQTGKPYLEEDEKGFEIQRIRSFKFAPYQGIYVSAGAYRSIAAIFDEFQPELVHIQTPLGLGWDALAAARRRRLPIISTNHSLPDNLIDNLRGMKYFRTTIDYALRKYGQLFFRGVDIATMPTQLAADMVVPKDFKKPVYVLSNGVDLKEYKPTTDKESYNYLYEKYNIPRDKKIAIFVGRIDPEKHLSVIIDALALLKKLEEDIFGIFVGAGADFERQKEHAAQTTLADSHVFTGRVSEEDKIGLLQIADVYAIASPAELQCIAALEAMATGLPVVVVKAGALPELCEEGVNGYQFELDDVEGAAAGIKKVLCLPTAEYKKMRKAARTMAENHDIEKAMDKFETLYAQTIDEAMQHVVLDD